MSFLLACPSCGPRDVAQLVGEEGTGVRTIIEMVNHTRLDCVLGSTALMRRAVAEATHHTAHRAAFGRLLAEQPLMLNVLADLCVESEAATVTALRVARAFDEGDAGGTWERERRRFEERILAQPNDEFERGRTAGRALSLGEAVEYALSDD